MEVGTFCSGIVEDSWQNIIQPVLSLTLEEPNLCFEVTKHAPYFREYDCEFLKPSFQAFLKKKVDVVETDETRRRDENAVKMAERKEELTDMYASIKQWIYGSVAMISLIWTIRYGFILFYKRG